MLISHTSARGSLCTKKACRSCSPLRKVSTFSQTLRKPASASAKRSISVTSELLLMTAINGAGTYYPHSCWGCVNNTTTDCQHFHLHIDLDRAPGPDAVASQVGALRRIMGAYGRCGGRA